MVDPQYRRKGETNRECECLERASCATNHLPEGNTATQNPVSWGLSARLIAKQNYRDIDVFLLEKTPARDETKANGKSRRIAARVEYPGVGENKTCQIEGGVWSAILRQRPH